MAGEEIQKTRVRDGLQPRVHEPYWRALERGRALGFRKIAADKGYWIARMRPDGGGAKYEYEPLGEVSISFGWDAAKAAAEKWFKRTAAGIKTGDVVTVEDACRAYVKERQASKSEACAHDAEIRFQRTVYGKTLGQQKLEKLRAATVRDWRDGLKCSPGTTNRTLTALKAALNLAVREKHAPVELALELRLVKPLPGGKNRRDLYLDLKQRRALLGAAQGAVRDLIEGVALTGARAGELVRATVSQFDTRTKSMTFAGKTGSRTVPLSPPAVALFDRLATDKRPTDRLFQRDDGHPWAHSDWDEYVREVAKAAKLPAEPRTGVCLYTLRHSFITEALDGGKMGTLEVARLVGTSVMMIEKNYGHLAAKAAQKRLAKVVML
jgi:integrase